MSQGVARLGAALLIAATAAACASRPPAEQKATCDGFVPARLVGMRPPEYPAPARRARMSGETTHEVVVDASGVVRNVQIVGTTFMVFALASDGALRGARYEPATLDGRPVGSRFWARVPFGLPQKIESSPARNRVTAFVPGSQPSAARWQLAGRIGRVTVVTDVASAPPSEVSVVAVAPDGAERELVRARSRASGRIIETVSTGDFFRKPGEYRLVLRHGERTLTQGAFTVAENEKSAVVNVCGAPG